MLSRVRTEYVAAETLNSFDEALVGVVDEQAVSTFVSDVING